MRFELTEACTSPPFQDGALNRSANPPIALLLYPMTSRLSLVTYSFFSFLCISKISSFVKGNFDIKMLAKAKLKLTPKLNINPK